MIISIKKRSLVIAMLVFSALLVLVPLVYAVTKIGFKVELVISNRNPVINGSWNVTGGGSSFSVDLVDGGQQRVVIVFNVSDADGVAEINASTAVVNFTLGTIGSGQFYTNVSAILTSEFGGCGNYTTNNLVIINCTVILPYFANASANWVINISIKDKNGGVGRNDTGRFTINTLSAISLPYVALNFSSVNIGQQNVPAYPHLLINNTGNDDFEMINISATALVGTTTSSENVPVTSFFANVTNGTAGLGQALALTPVSLINVNDAGRNVSLIHGHTGAFTPNADKGNISVFFWVDVPSSSLSSQLYNATWNVTVINS